MDEGGKFCYFKLHEIVNIVAGTAAGTRGRKQRQYVHGLREKTKGNLSVGQ